MKPRRLFLILGACALVAVVFGTVLLLSLNPALAYDCQAIAAKARSCYVSCWNRIQSGPMRPCFTSTMHRCQSECRPEAGAAHACRRELPDVFRKCCFLCAPEPVED
ncbi:MAG: hypothetical protein GYA21_08325 [Myxococcales bacterium]|nr:hypothetical protein [Myxococcales bacterium]